MSTTLTREQILRVDRTTAARELGVTDVEYTEAVVEQRRLDRIKAFCEERHAAVIAGRADRIPLIDAELARFERLWAALCETSEGDWSHVPTQQSTSCRARVGN